MHKAYLVLIQRFTSKEMSPANFPFFSSGKSFKVYLTLLMEMPMSLFRVKEPYLLEQKPIRLIEFQRKNHLYVKRPPYQRKTVWSRQKQLQLIDSFFRQFYVPGIVLRQVDFAEGKFKYEVVDGQQRINSIQRFFSNEIPLPKSLRGLTSEAGKNYEDLSDEVQAYVEDLKLHADVLRMIEDPKSVKNQRMHACKTKNPSVGVTRSSNKL